MNKQFLLFTFVFSLIVLSAVSVSAEDAFVFTDVSDARLLIIDNSGNTNSTGWLAENGVKLSDTYCGLGGCAFTGIVSSDSNITTTTFFVGDGTYLTNVAGANSSWTQSYAETLFTNQTYVDAQDVIFNNSMAEYTLFVNGTMKDYVDAQISGIGGMDYTNLALINITNTFVPQQIFTGGLNSVDDIILNTTKLISWDDGGSISGTAGVITFKAGV